MSPCHLHVYNNIMQRNYSRQTLTDLQRPQPVDTETHRPVRSRTDRHGRLAGASCPCTVRLRAADAGRIPRVAGIAAKMAAAGPPASRLNPQMTGQREGQLSQRAAADRRGSPSQGGNHHPTHRTLPGSDLQPAPSHPRHPTALPRCSSLLARLPTVLASAVTGGGVL